MKTRHLPSPSQQLLLWSGWVVAALLVLPVLSGTLFGVVVPLSALALAACSGPLPRAAPSRERQRRDLAAIAALYLAIVALLRLAFVVFTTDHVAGLFLSFAAALLLGVVGPVALTVWVGHGSVADLGLRGDHLRPTVALALLFAGVQFALTLWGYDLPTPADWVPLLVMAPRRRCTGCTTSATGWAPPTWCSSPASAWCTPSRSR